MATRTRQLGGEFESGKREGDWSVRSRRLEPSLPFHRAQSADARHVLNETLGEIQHDLDSVDDNRQDRALLLAWQRTVLAVLDLT